MRFKARVSSFLLAGFLLMTGVARPDVGAGERLSAGRGTNLSVDSGDIEDFLLKDKTKDKDDRLVFYRNKDMAVDINDTGDPNMNLRF